MGKTWDIVDEQTCRLRSVGYDLHGLSDAFARTGNAQLADELFAAAGAVADAADLIQTAYREERSVQVDQSLANGQRFVGAILTGLLDGAQPKDALLAGCKHHLDRDIIEAHEAGGEN